MWNSDHFGKNTVNVLVHFAKKNNQYNPLKSINTPTIFEENDEMIVYVVIFFSSQILAFWLASFDKIV